MRGDLFGELLDARIELGQLQISRKDFRRVIGRRGAQLLRRDERDLRNSVIVRGRAIVKRIDDRAGIVEDQVIAQAAAKAGRVLNPKCPHTVRDARREKLRPCRRAPSARNSAANSKEPCGRVARPNSNAPAASPVRIIVSRIRSEPAFAVKICEDHAAPVNFLRRTDSLNANAHNYRAALLDHSRFRRVRRCR